MRRPIRNTLTLAALVAGVAVLMGGCALDDVELNGGVFDALGVNDTAKKSEPKLAERAPLVVPPGLERLPPPGVPAESLIADVTPMINDPDRAAVVNQAELQKQQAEYCRKHYELPKATGDNSADLAEGPLGKCRPSILTAVQQWNGPKVDEDEK